MADAHARQITRILSAQKIHKYSTSKRFAKEYSSHAKKETDGLGWFYLFEYHILGMVDILKQIKHLVKF